MIGKTGLHAIRAMAVLARLPEHGRAGAASLAQTIGAPPNYLGKLLQVLVRQQLVESRKGLHGGFRLARDPRRISLLEVLEPFEPVRRWNGCFLGEDECSEDRPCAVHERWARFRKQYVDMLSQTTIADVIRRNEEGR